MDRDPNVKRVWTQPFRLDGLDPERGNRYHRPTPDMLVEYRDERLEVVEVKPARRLEKPQLDSFDGDVEEYERATSNWLSIMRSFDFQQREYAVHGWELTTRSELSKAERANLEYLSLYRRPLHRDDTLKDEILDAASAPMRLTDLADAVTGGFISAMPVILHLVWHRELEMDMDTKIGSSTVVYNPKPTSALKAAA